MRLVLLLTCAACFGREMPFVFAPAAEPSRFLGRTPNGTVLLHPEGAVLRPDAAGRPVRMTFRGASAGRAEPIDRASGESNFLSGSDPARWRRHVPHYARVRYAGVYPGIDIVYYASGTQLEYDFVVAPGASPESIEVSFDGADTIATDSRGDLRIRAGGSVIRHRRPVVVQDGRNISASYRIAGNRVRIALGAFDRSRGLVIDPVVEFSTYAGRAGYESATAIAVDPFGNTILAGETTSADWASPAVFQREKSRDTDAYVAKIGRGGDLQFITYFGGNRNDLALGVGTDASGNVYLSGVTFSTTLPVRNAPQPEFGGGEMDCFAAKLNSSGSELIWSTYLGGNGDDWANGLAIDREGGAWLAGWTRSGNFPFAGGLQPASAGGGGDAFVTRIDPSGRRFAWSSYLGSEGSDSANGIAVDAAGMVYLTGSTTSRGFPAARPAQLRPAGREDAFILKLDPSRNQIVTSTYLGGSGDDAGIRIAADPRGNAYAIGYTGSADFPVSAGAVQRALSGKTDIFVASIDGGTGSLRYATYLGGSGDDWAGGIAVDDAGTAYATGWTESSDFPVRNASQPAYRGGTGPTAHAFDAIVARLAPSGDSLLFSTFFGGAGDDRAYGIALDRSGTFRIAGTTTSPDLPGSDVQRAPGGGDAFVAGFSADSPVDVLVAQPSSLTLGRHFDDTAPQAVSISLRSTGIPLTWSATADAPWIRIISPSGTTPGTLSISVEPAAALPSDTQSGNIRLQTPAGVVSIPVLLVAGYPPAITAVSPSALAAGSADASVQITGSGFSSSAVVELGGRRVPATVADANNIRATVPAELLRTPGQFEIVVTNPDLRSAPARLTVAASVPALKAFAHAATWKADPVAPGEMVVLGGSGFGPDTIQSAVAQDNRLPVSLAGVSVFFDATPAPVLWVARGQVCVVVPWSVIGRISTSVAVELAGLRSAPMSIPVAPAAPGLFTATGSGQGQAAARNQDGSANTPATPAERGSVLVLYGTGEGVVSPAVPSGTVLTGESLPRPVLPVSVRLGGIDAAVEYAGSVPGSAVGLFQVNVRVPQNAPAGDAVAVSLSVGSHTSPVGVTVALR